MSWCGKDLNESHNAAAGSHISQGRDKVVANFPNEAVKFSEKEMKLKKNPPGPPKRATKPWSKKSVQGHKRKNWIKLVQTLTHRSNWSKLWSTVKRLCQVTINNLQLEPNNLPLRKLVVIMIQANAPTSLTNNTLHTPRKKTEKIL